MASGRSPTSSCARSSSAADQSPRLTARQLELLRILATGATYEEAGQRLGISHQTVKNHMTGAYRRLNVGNLAAAFVELGWLAPRQAYVWFEVPSPTSYLSVTS